MVTRIAACDCGEVRFRAAGRPIVGAICYCTDCQEAGRRMEQAGARPDFRDAWGGTPYASYSANRFECLEGAGLLRGFKLTDDAPTTRFVATCCNSAIYLKFGPGWWVSVYRARFGESAPPLEMRNQVEHAQNRDTLPSDLPTHRDFPLKLFWRLLRARFNRRMSSRDSA